MGNVARAVRLASASVAAGIAGTLLAVPAAASPAALAGSERAGNSAHSLCNWTEGSGTHVDHVQAQRAQDLGRSPPDR